MSSGTEALVRAPDRATITRYGRVAGSSRKTAKSVGTASSMVAPMTLVRLNLAASKPARMPPAPAERLKVASVKPITGESLAIPLKLDSQSGRALAKVT